MAFAPSIATRTFAIITLLGSLPCAAQAEVIQLTSPPSLKSPRVTTAEYTSTEDLLASPLVLTFPDNTVTLTLAVGDWRRADQGVNWIGDFNPGTKLLYTNNNNFLGFDGMTTVGGGGSGPVEIEFANAVDLVSLRAQTSILGPESFTFSAYDGDTLLGTFTVEGVSGQRSDEQFAALLAARAKGGDCITRVVISSLAFGGPGDPGANDFAFGPVSFRTVRGRRCETRHGSAGFAMVSPVAKR
jgi:hypothetical protein